MTCEATGNVHFLSTMIWIMFVDFFTPKLFFQWGAAYCVRGGPERERLAMEVILFIYYFSNLAFLDEEC